MKTAFVVFSLCFLALASAQEGPAAAPAIPSELAAVSQSWTDARTKSQVPLIQRKAEAKAAYLTGLATLEKQAQQKGDLSNVLAARAEKERVESGQETTTEMREAMSPEFRAWRGKYAAALQSLEAESARLEQALRAKYLQDLQALQVDLTQRGKFEAALAVKKAREQAPAEPAPAPAAEPPAATPPAPPATTPPVPAMARPPAAAATPFPSSAGSATDKLTQKLLSGEWKVGGTSFFFEADGKMRSRAPGAGKKGTWKTVGPRAIEFTMDGDKAPRSATFPADLSSFDYSSAYGKGSAKYAPRADAAP